MEDMIKLVSEAGISVVCVATILWLMCYIVKRFIDKFAGQMDAMQERMRKHDSKADERGKYIREEHHRMIDSLKEIGQTLLRINGHKHD